MPRITPDNGGRTTCASSTAPPAFAAEVRSENDSGLAAESEMADKRSDYFAAGTLVVWDVDPVAQTVAA